MPHSQEEEDIEKMRNTTKESLEESYQRRYKEIESLRLYSRGEKEIIPVDLAAEYYKTHPRE